MSDPFAIFGLEPTPEPDMSALEDRFIALSRESHPDLVHAADSSENLKRLMRSAELNDAWRTLQDPWARARAALELRDPGVLDRTSQLPPDLLMELMELQEEAVAAAPEQHADLRHKAQAALDAAWTELTKDFDAGDFAAAARQVHLARYHQRTLAAVTPDVTTS